MQSQCGWQELCPNQILQLLALILDRLRWNTIDRRHEWEDVIWPYKGWDTNHKFRWKVDSEQGPSWIDTNSIFIGWKP